LTTAHDALFTLAGLALGERVCIHGAREASERPASNRRLPWKLGAIAVDPTAFVEDGPFDVVLESIGGSNVEGDIQALATGGRTTVVGPSGGMTPELNPTRYGS
jgi:NADPH:quinone reductase-like Zn-dependent oxidoreductase